MCHRSYQRSFVSARNCLSFVRTLARRYDDSLICGADLEKKNTNILMACQVSLELASLAAEDDAGVRSDFTLAR